MNLVDHLLVNDTGTDHKHVLMHVRIHFAWSKILLSQCHRAMDFRSYLYNYCFYFLQWSNRGALNQITLLNSNTSPNCNAASLA